MLGLKKETTRETLQKRLQEFHHKQTLFLTRPLWDLDNLIQVKSQNRIDLAPYFSPHARAARKYSRYFNSG